MADNPLQDNTQAVEKLTELLKEQASKSSQQGGAAHAFDFKGAMGFGAGGMLNSFLEDLMKRFQAGKGAAVPGALEKKLEDAWKQGTAKTFDDLKRIADQHFAASSTPKPPAPPGPPVPPSPRQMTATEAATALARQASAPGQPFLPGSSAGDFNRSLQPKFTQLMPQAPVAHRMTAAEVAAYQAANPQAQSPTPPKPPPVPPHIAMLSAALGQSMERGNELRDFLRQNPDMGGSLAAKGLRGAMTAQDTFISNQFAGLSPAEQQTQMPAMQALEQQRKQIEEEELRRRKQFSEEAKHGSGVLSHFAMTMGMAGGAVAGAISQATKYAGAANPGSTSTFQTSLQIMRGSVGQSLGLPESFNNSSRLLQRGAESLNESTRSGGFMGRAVGALGKLVNFEDTFKLIEKLSPSKDFKQNLFMPMKTRITTGEEYEQGLANAALESSGESADLKLLQDQMRNSNMLLREIARNTGGSNSPAFGN